MSACCPYCGGSLTGGLGGRMRLFRASRRMGVREAAALAGVGFSTWARIERGFCAARETRWRIEQMLAARTAMQPY